MQSKCRHLSIPKGQSICSCSQSINCMFFDDGPITSTSAFDGSLQNSLPLHYQHTNTLGTCCTWRWSSCPWRGSPSCSFPCSASAIPAASLSRLHICGHSQLLQTMWAPTLCILSGYLLVLHLLSLSFLSWVDAKFPTNSAQSSSLNWRRSLFLCPWTLCCLWWLSMI